MKLWCLEVSCGQVINDVNDLIQTTIRSLTSVCIPGVVIQMHVVGFFFFNLKNVDSQKSCRISTESSHVPPASRMVPSYRITTIHLAKPGCCPCCSPSNK